MEVYSEDGKFISEENKSDKSVYVDRKNKKRVKLDFKVDEFHTLIEAIYSHGCKTKMSVWESATL